MSSKEKEEYIKKHLGLNEVKIIKKKIPYNSLIIYNNQRVYLSGYGTAHKKCECTNAVEFKIKKNDQKKWKNSLNYIFNGKKNKGYNFYLKEIFNYVIECKKNYPLYETSMEKIKNSVNVDILEEEEMKAIILECIKIYKCSSDAKINILKTKILEEKYGIKEKGRLADQNIKNFILICKSPTGLKEKKYEF